MGTPAALDFISIGRASVDLYGHQIGGRLEDMASFAKSVGGSPTNIAIGGARLGLRAGLITRVGDEAMGRFIREQLEREGVSLGGVVTDRERLTALVLLGVRDGNSFPLIFYRENCADMALSEADIDDGFIASANAVVATGTHFSTERVAGASRKAIRLAKANGRKVVLDIDYRPNLWGLAGHGAGESRYIRSDTVTAHLQSIVGDCDLVVGTEEEIMIAGGREEPLAAARRLRDFTSAVIVVKRGPMGCTVFPGAIPDRFEDGISGPGFPVEVYNVLGAGDAFMAGFLRGWLRGESLATSAAWANACGAFAVSRLLCSPESPSFEELQHFLIQGSSQRALRKDGTLNHIHWGTTRRPQPETLFAFAIDHRSQLEAMAAEAKAPPGRIGRFKELALAATLRVAGRRSGFGMLLDGTYGSAALSEAAGHPLWLGRPVELPGSRPLEFEAGPDIGSHLLEWPVTQTVKCLAHYHPDDPKELREIQDRRLLQLGDACRTLGRELMVEIICCKHGPRLDDTVARVLDHLYLLGLKPDWWKLEPQVNARAWARIEDVISRHDPYCRGIVLLGLDAPEQELMRLFAVAANVESVKGFAVGRTLFGTAARDWFADRITDEQAVADMATRFQRLVDAWKNPAVAAEPELRREAG